MFVEIEKSLVFVAAVSNCEPTHNVNLLFLQLAVKPLVLATIVKPQTTHKPPASTPIELGYFPVKLISQTLNLAWSGK